MAELQYAAMVETRAARRMTEESRKPSPPMRTGKHACDHWVGETVAPIHVSKDAFKASDASWIAAVASPAGMVRRR